MPQGVPRSRMLLAVALIPAVALGGAVVLSVWAQDRLPDPIASHWGWSGQPDGTSALAPMRASMVSLALVLWVLGALGLVTARRLPARFRVERGVMAMCAGSVTFFSAVLVVVVRANLDAPTWVDTELSGLSMLPVLAAAATAGGLAWWVAGPPPPEVPRVGAIDEVSPLAVPELVPGEARVWEGAQWGPLLVATSLVLALAGVVLVAATDTALGWLLLVVAAVTVPLDSVRVRVDPSGLSVRFGPLGWPRRRLGIATVAAVALATIEPVEWGGWGYRVLPGRQAVVLRRGPGIVVRRHDGRHFAVTVDDAATGAGLLEAYRRARVPPG